MAALALPSLPSSLDAVERVICDLLTREGEAMWTLLADLVAINSGSTNLAGIRRVGEACVSFLTNLGFDVTLTGSADGPSHLIARTRAQETTPGKRLLLLSHMDTVFPPESPLQRLALTEGGGTGPGVTDAKGGIVCLLFALRALASVRPLTTVPISVVLVGDEERGSPTARALLEEEASRHDLALVFEPARRSGAIVKARKGTAHVTLTTYGKGAHPGAAPEAGANAIVALAEKILAIHALQDSSRGLTVNVGVISGGTVTNRVPEEAEARIEFRYWQAADAEAIVGRIREIAAAPSIPGVRAEVRVRMGRPAWPENPSSTALAEFWIRQATRLGLPLTAEATGGASDGNLTAAFGLPTLDGLGPEGGDQHTETEFIVRSSLLTRSQLASTALYRLTS